jgi:type IV pilus assembly protein PilC
MPKFKYAGVDEGGKRRRGTIDAVIVDDARIQLSDRGLRSLEVSESAQFWKFQGVSKAKVKRTELIHFSRQLAAFVRAGVPILDAIDTLAGESHNAKMSEVLEDVDEGLRKGEMFSAAIGRHPDVFPNFYVAILKSAELTGQLDTVLDQLAVYLQRDESTRRKIRSALTYPMVVIVLAIIAVTVLTIFVLPHFEKFFQQFDAKLPLATRILIGITDFLTTYGVFLLAALVIAVVLSMLYFRTVGGRRHRDRLVLRMPILGSVVEYSLVERFCRILSATVRAGVPAPEAMAVASASVGNVVYQAAIDDAREAMMQGEGMAAPIARSGVFPGIACQMIRVGEETGTLDEQLETAASYFGEEAEYRMERFTNMLEPTVIIVVGVIVGFVAVALVSAMYGIYNQVQIQ